MHKFVALQYPKFPILNFTASIIILYTHTHTFNPHSLCRVLERSQAGEISAAQKTVFMFLHHLYTNCSYLQTTYRAFGRSLYIMGEKVGVGKESYPPPTVRSDSERQRPDAIANISKPR